MFVIYYVDLLRGYVSFITRMFVIYYVDICIFAVTCGVSFKASTTACWDRVKSTLIPVKPTILPLLIRLVCALRYSYLNCAYLCYLCFDVCRLWSIGEPFISGCQSYRVSRIIV